MGQSFLIDSPNSVDSQSNVHGKLLLRNGMDYVIKERKKVTFEAMVNEMNFLSLNSFLSEGFTLSSQEVLNQQKFFCYFKNCK